MSVSKHSVTQIGKVKVQGDIVMVPLEKLVEDVPVNENHVRNLAENIKQEGQATPLLVWAQENRVIDGFHRVRAMKRIGLKEAVCILYSCDDEQFWRLRILSAASHHTVHYSRVVQWIRMAFNKTKWGQMISADEALRVGKRGAALRQKMTPADRNELTQWLEEKSREWNMPIARLVRYIQLARRVQVPGLIALVRDDREAGAFTQRKLEAIVTKLSRADLQQAVSQKARVEKLTHRDVEDLVKQVANARSESLREKLLQIPYQRPRRGRPPKSAVRELHEIRAKIVSESIDQLTFVLPQIQQPQPFDGKLPEALAVLARYLGKEDITALEILQRENQSLKEGNRKQADEISRKDDLIATQRRNIEGLQQRIDSLIEDLKRS